VRHVIGRNQDRRNRQSGVAQTFCGEIAACRRNHRPAIRRKPLEQRRRAFHRHNSVARSQFVTFKQRRFFPYVQLYRKVRPQFAQRVDGPPPMRCVQDFLQVKLMLFGPPLPYCLNALGRIHQRAIHIEKHRAASESKYRVRQTSFNASLRAAPTISTSAAKSATSVR
jgi:hypothetical protein